jgi:hypothetical protein
MHHRKTPIAARELGVSYHRLINLVRFGKIVPPLRDTSGDYLWTDDDLGRARAALATVRRPKQQGAVHAS